MHIHLGGENGCLQSIELTRVNHHKALPHLSKLIANDTTGNLHTINKICIENSILNDLDYHALHVIFHECNELHDIKLNSNHIDLAHLIELFSVLPHKQLTSISLTDNWIGEKVSSEAFEFLTSQQELFSIDFSLNWLGDKGVCTLLDALNNNIHQLQLSCNDFQLEGMAAICHFTLQCHALHELDISYNRLDAASAKQIARIIHGSNSIKSIKANSNQLSDAGAALIVDAMQGSRQLEALDLSDNGISLMGAKNLIEGALKTGTVKHLDLRHNALNQSAIEHIKDWHGIMDVLV